MTMSKTIVLPEPRMTGTVALETAIAERHSSHHFIDEKLTLDILSQLLWGMQGIRDSRGNRTVPSAGGLYPLDIYVASKDGLFHYDPIAHELESLNSRDIRSSLSHAALGEEAIAAAPAVFVITTEYQKMSEQFGEEHGVRFAILECGHAAQNLLLQAQALGLATVPIGTFRDSDVEQFLDLPHKQHVIYLIPTGFASPGHTEETHHTQDGR